MLERKTREKKLTRMEVEKKSLASLDVINIYTISV